MLVFITGVFNKWGKWVIATRFRHFATTSTELHDSKKHCLFWTAMPSRPHASARRLQPWNPSLINPKRWRPQLSKHIAKTLDIEKTFCLQSIPSNPKDTCRRARAALPRRWPRAWNESNEVSFAIIPNFTKREPEQYINYKFAQVSAVYECFRSCGGPSPSAPIRYNSGALRRPEQSLR